MHTPGPWVAKPRSTGGYNICAVDDVVEDTTVGTAILDFFSFEEARDNARIMAAGPKMLQELRRSADCLATFINEHPDPGTEALAALHCARAAIAEAEPQP